MIDPTRTFPPAEGVTGSFAGVDITRTVTDPSSHKSSPDPLSPVGYELREEIGRGGMGVVYRAHDRAMNREVAVKVLADRYAPDSPTARRFLEEAQITGQLSHPGIPAVHQVGALPDGRPFLAMKLIKGQTLDIQLASREHERPEFGRWLGVFEAICQAVGYAHSKGVIHRDLKPANVMVGAFGEVQVMDWGLAKVLLATRQRERPEESEPLVAHAAGSPSEIRIPRESDHHLTQAGSVLGTPAFMSPEQAGGEIDRIDERSDVFGLGAVLCTLLTGLPPYSGPSGEAVRLLAVRGQTAEAFARLDACGAEPDLVALCKRCLSFAPTNRPANAGELATVVADFRRTSEERARQAELDRAKTEVKAAERRKRRWVLAALAVSMSLLAMLTAGGLGWRWYEKRAEQEVVRKAVTSLLDTAEQAVRDNQTAAAAAALENVGSRLSGYESELPAMHARYETLDRDHRTLLALDRLQTRTEIFERPKWEEYRAVFTENGVRFEDGYREAGERLRASVTSRQLIRVMHQHYTSWNFRDAGSKEMIAALDVADPDPFRVRLRQAVHGENPRDVAGVMASATSEQRSVESVGWLLRTGFLPLAERRELGLELLSRQPNDYETLVDMAFLEEDAGRREADLIIGYWRAALAARPQSAFSHIAVGEAARRLKQDLPTAKAHFREAILLAPSDGTPWSHLGRVLTAEKNSDEAIRAHEKAIELSPNLALSHYQLAFLYAEREDEGRSAAALRTALKLDDTLAYGGYGVEEGRMPSLIRLVRKLVRELPDDAELHWVLSQFLRNSGDQQAARPHAERAAKLDPQSHRFWYDLGIIYTDLSDAEAALTAFHSHHQLKPDDPSRRTKVGETLVALHRYEEAVTEFREVLDETDDDEARRGLGKALVALGKMDEGLKQFRRDYTFDDTPFGKLVSKRLIQDLAVHFPHEALTVCRRILNDHPTWGEDWEYCSFLRYEAACYALRCSVQDGKDVPAIIDSAALRNEAFAWLRDDFTARGRAAGLDTEYRSWLHDMLEHYLTDKDLAPVRDPAELAKLSESERQAWGQLWADVRKLHADTAPPREVLPPPRRVQ